MHVPESGGNEKPDAAPSGGKQRPRLSLARLTLIHKLAQVRSDGQQRRRGWGVQWASEPWNINPTCHFSHTLLGQLIIRHLLFAYRVLVTTW